MSNKKLVCSKSDNIENSSDNSQSDSHVTFKNSQFNYSVSTSSEKQWYVIKYFSYKIPLLNLFYV